MMGCDSLSEPVDPRKGASPKENSSPSEATSQYPWPLSVAAIPTMCLATHRDRAGGLSPEFEVWVVLVTTPPARHRGGASAARVGRLAPR